MQNDQENENKLLRCSRLVLSRDTADNLPIKVEGWICKHPTLKANRSGALVPPKVPPQISLEDIKWGESGLNQPESLTLFEPLPPKKNKTKTHISSQSRAPLGPDEHAPVK